MKLSLTLLAATMAAVSSSSPAGLVERATPKVYLAGDSTMALGGGGSGTQGWGPYFPFSTKNVEVVNKAIGGRSARSYWNEGRFTAIANLVVPGDWVIIEFGHNDGGSLSPTNDNLRTACVGSGTETCTGANGAIVQTYVTYLTWAAKAIVAKGAKVIISSPTPNNPCEGTTCTYTAPRFTGYCKIVVANVGSSASFIDHGQYTGNRFIAIGKAKVDTYFPVDHTHPSGKGSDVVQAAFVKGVLCSGNPFGSYIKNTTATVLGNCI